MKSWVAGRVVLVGDAAACPSLLAGDGAALAMTAAYVLAGELSNSRDLAAALSRYSACLRPLFARKQDAAARFASFFAPQTRFGISARNLLTRSFAIPFVADLALAPTVRHDFILPDYPWNDDAGRRSGAGGERRPSSRLSTR
jgi:2-polyprenyl-6-methoxyphenol hydroxylase-like FAD-dependent oxidoreductase